MSDVNQKILDAIELLATHSVQKAGYDRTIQAQILSCTDPTIGKYKCKYQDAIIYAYTTNSDISLSKGTFVYILVPENDMSKDKTIIGTTEKLGVNYVSVAEGEQAYYIIGNNCINSSGVYNLDIDKNNYSLDIYVHNNDNENQITFDVNSLQQYLKQSSSLIIAAKIKTNIDSPKQIRGHYGITFTLRFKGADDTYVLREYTLNENNMVGNPYRMFNQTRQSAIFDIDGANFDRIEKVTIFNSDFPGAVENPPAPITYEITLSDLQLLGAVRLPEEEINGLALTFYTPQGTFFTQGSLENSYKTITAQVRVKGKLASDSQNIEFYWGIEDAGVTSEKVDYNKYLGRGWRCLNSYNVIDSTLAIESPILNLIEWIPGKETYLFYKSSAVTYNNVLKVAAVYGDTVLTKEINIKNFDKDVDFIKITSSNGNHFYYGVGTTELTCEINSSTSYGGLTYHWAWQNYGSLQENITNDFATVNGNKVQNLIISKIFNFATFKCTVYDEDQALLGTASIILTNSTQGQGFNSLIINNGTVVFKYDADGVAPTVEGKTLTENREGPQVIQHLSFTLYDESGEAISSTEINNPYLCTIKWGIPINNTMIVDKNNGTPIAAPENGDKYIYYSNYILNYDICPVYDASKVENQIILSVTYRGIVYTAETNFTFVKEGYAGTNGTDYMVKLVPNTLLPNPPEFPIITKINGGDVKINYGIDSGDEDEESTLSGNQQLLKAQLWYKGQIVWQGFSKNDTGTITPSEVKWSVLANKYNSSVSDASDFVINDATNGSMTYTYSNSSDPKANIIKCAITYNNKVYYGTLPIMTAWVSNSDYRVKLKENSGFRYVLYAADGTNPEYSTAYPFEFLIEEVPQGTNVSNVSYATGTVGSVKFTTSNPNDPATSINLFISLDSPEGLADNQFKYKPTPRYDGLCVNAAIDCTYTDSSDNTIAKLRVPVHFILNKYGLSNLNAWDGNSIQINDDGGYILAPQMGAGVKDNQNRFTGVLMGEVHNAGKSSADIGLLGYHEGDRSFFLNSENGSAIFGKSGNGQIIIDPRSNTNKALLYSSSYWSQYGDDGLPTSYGSGNEAGAGLLIDLTTPQIKYGNGGFSVDSNGSLSLGNNSFRVDQYGNMVAGPIRNNDTITGYNFSVAALTGDVTMKGSITATSGYIGSDSTNKWTIGGNSSKAWIYSGGKQSLGSTAQGVYFGTDGISIYKDVNEKALEINFSNHTAYFDLGTITLSKDTVVTWGDSGNTNIEHLITDIINGNDQRSYITGTFINGRTIKSPTIYGGQFYATGKGNPTSQLETDRPAYYISPGLDPNNNNEPNPPIGFIAYDQIETFNQNENYQVGDLVQYAASQYQPSKVYIFRYNHEAGPWDQSEVDEVYYAPQRVIFKTNSRAVLKITSSGDMSLSAGSYWPQNPGKIYFESNTIFNGQIQLCPVRTYTTGTTWGCYGEDDPGNLSYYPTLAGQLYFKLDPVSS